MAAADLDDLRALVAVARHGGFRQAARIDNTSASALSEAVRRLEAAMGVRLLNRTTRSVLPTEAGRRLIDRLSPALGEIGAAMAEAAGTAGRPGGTLTLNVPVSVARLVLPSIVPGFLAANPGIHLEIVCEERFVDIVALGCDAGIRYEERLDQDMIALPIGPRVQHVTTAAAPAYLAAHGTPAHPRDLLGHACLQGRFASGVIYPWEFERDGKVLRVEPSGPLVVGIGGAADLLVEAACAGAGFIHLFDAWLAPHVARGALVPVLEEWTQRFSGPFLYYPGRRLVPAPLRAFIDYVRMTDPVTKAA